MTSLAPLASRFRYNEKALERAVEGLAAPDWLHRIDGRTSHAYWLLGHLAASRRGLLRGIGKERPPAPWEKLFSKGSLPGERADDPSPQALMEDIVRSGELIQSHFATLTAEGAAGPYGRTFPDGSSTVEGAVHFLFWHETYHIGQLGLLRRACGKPGLA